MQTLCGHVDKPLARLAHIPTQPYYQALLSMLVSTRNDEGPCVSITELLCSILATNLQLDAFLFYLHLHFEGFNPNFHFFHPW